MSVVQFHSEERWMCSDVQLLGYSPSVALLSPASESWLSCCGERQVKECV